VLYTSTPLGLVAALDAETGVELWTFDPQAWKDRGWFTSLHRGVAYWSDGDDERILFGTTSAYLYSLDARTGLPDPAFGDSGRVDLTRGLRRPIRRSQYAVVSPPIVCRDVLVVGSSVPDVRSGAQKWVFETIPQEEGAYGRETWGADSWKDFGGVNVWSMMSADQDLGYVYLPVSTPSNDFYGGERPGDNLFGDSIVCLNAGTGERVWHFQITHHGLWDYDPPAAPILVDIEVEGRPIKAVVQVTKQAQAFVFDRITGAPVWPIVEVPVPASRADGEIASPTQPFPSWPLPFDLQGLRIDDLIAFTPELRRRAIEQVGRYEYGPLYTPPSERGTILLPGLRGGASWVGAAADPLTGVLYVPSHTMPFMAVLTRADDPQSPSAYSTNHRHNVKGPDGLPLTRPPYGRLTAIDLNTGEHLWKQVWGAALPTTRPCSTCS
jgi:quinoprotein glucose dehydrogenase